MTSGSRGRVVLPPRVHSMARVREHPLFMWPAALAMLLVCNDAIRGLGPMTVLPYAIERVDARPANHSGFLEVPHRVAELHQ